MVCLRIIAALFCVGLALGCRAQSVPVPDAPQPQALAADGTSSPDNGGFSSSAVRVWPDAGSAPQSFAQAGQAVQAAESAAQENQYSKPAANDPLDSEGKPIPLEMQQPKRILGIMPNFRSVSGGSKPHPPGWKYNFIVATHQATDYSTFFFLGLTTLTAEGMNMHPVLGKGVDGFYAYGWRGFLDKTDGTYLSAWLLPSILHEDTRFYALGAGHSIPIRALYVISRQAVARTYGGRQTPNIAGLGGKVLTQVVSRTYYPPSAATFSVLAAKFGYSAMRDIAFSSVREYYPDIAAHYIRKHREKVARLSAIDAAQSQ
jgi:hypothetical protein